jgi:hypothetical protein
VTLGLPCIIDNTTFTDIGLNGQQYHSVLTRDNCHTPQLYCEEGSLTCQPTKPMGLACLGDQQCESVRSLPSVIDSIFSNILCSTIVATKMYVLNHQRRLLKLLRGSTW